MVVHQVDGLVDFAVPRDWLDSLLHEHRHNEFADNCFGSAGCLHGIGRVHLCRNVCGILETQSRDLPTTVRQMESFIRL